MTQGQLKRALFELVTLYFGEDLVEVSWGMTKRVASGAPSVVLSMGDVARSYHPVESIAAGVAVQAYPSATTLQVDLYTRGERLSDEDGVTAAYENTAVSDLLAFVGFVNSGYAAEWAARNDVSILCSTVSDLSGLMNDSSWGYRAMAELEVSFTDYAVGHTGLMYDGGLPCDEGGNAGGSGAYVPTPSGGGTQHLADQTAGWFGSAEINEEEDQ